MSLKILKKIKSGQKLNSISIKSAVVVEKESKDQVTTVFPKLINKGGGISRNLKSTND